MNAEYISNKLNIIKLKLILQNVKSLEIQKYINIWNVLFLFLMADKVKIVMLF